MDLRSGQTVWSLIHGLPDNYPPLRRDAECDIAIIGGGITGALIAYELSKAGFDCLLIDKGTPGGGSTAASTALLLYELDTPLCELARHLGDEVTAAECYRACRDAVYKLEAMALDLGGPCEFVRRKSFYFAERDEDVSGLVDEFAVRRKYGLGVDFLERAEIESAFSFSRPAALLTHDAAEIDVFEFVGRLIRGAAVRGARVHGQTNVTSYSFDREVARLTTDYGCTISARKVVFATGYESEKYLKRKIGTLKSTFVVATEPISDFAGWPDRCLIWTSARPYLYLRTTTDGRAIIGGEDVDFEDEERRDALLPAKSAKLQQAFHTAFPKIRFQLACAWTGTFGESEDGLPYIGPAPELPGAYFALGYGGNGICFSVIASEIIRDHLLGRTNPNARHFGFDRRTHAL